MIKSFLWIVFLTAGWQAAWAFSLLGPGPTYPGLPSNFGDAWETPEITYNPLTAWDTANTGPKNWGEGYRRNTPVMYYACDVSFITFFGEHGTQAVDQAFDILNNAFTNNLNTPSHPNTNGVDGYSPSLWEFPLNSQSINYTAQGAGLLDLKSWTLHLLMEQLGLANPVRYTWTLHQRYLYPAPGATCINGDEEYLVVQRNFDTFTQASNQIPYSSYVNNTLYSYIIAEYCDAQSSPFGPQSVLADAVEFPVDPLADVFTPVAAGDGGWLIQNPAVPPFRPPIYLSNALFPFGFGLVVGGFYTGLTRDDAAGLRYLMRANNLVWESAAAGSILTSSSSGITNPYGPQILLYTSNYNAFWWSARTNAPATLSTMFPGLVILTSPYYFTNIPTPIVVYYYTNLIGAPYGSPPVLVVKTNGYTPNYLTIYSDTFANVVFTPNGHHPTTTSAQLVTVTVGVQTGAPVGSPLVTNTTTKAVTLINQPSGEYYINTNYLCGTNRIISTLGTNVTATTNLLFATLNSAGYFTSQSLVTYSTTHVYVVEQPICSTTVITNGATNGPGLYGGIEKIHFVKTSFDSMLGQAYQPITNFYTMIYVTNGHPVIQTFERVVTTPDILFTVADLAAPNPGAIGVAVPAELRTDPNFNVRNIPIVNQFHSLAGPGTIDPTTTIIYDKVGDVFVNGPAFTTNAFLNEASQLSMLAWGSFDNSTNAPVVYPNTDFGNLENQILAQLTTSPTSLPLPNGANGVAYPATTFIAAGAALVPLIGQLTWSATGLPSGLGVSTNGVLSGTPSDIAGTYDFNLQVIDEYSRSVHWTLPITIK